MSPRCLPVLVGSVALYATAAPLALAAQNWTAEQQAVIAVVEQSYVEALAKDVTWVDRFTHPQVLSWGTSEPVLFQYSNELSCGFSVVMA